MNFNENAQYTPQPQSPAPSGGSIQEESVFLQQQQLLQHQEPILV